MRDMENAECEKLGGFLEWAAKLGISDSPNNFHSLQPNFCLGNSLLLSYFPDAGGRGLGAARDLRRGELLLKVPKSALITRDILFRDQILFSAVNNNHTSLSPTQILAVCLLFEMGKGKSSFWYPYLIHLPRCYDILATFSEFEKQALQVDDSIWTAEKAISKAEAEWKEAFLLMQELQFRHQFLTLRAWIWASATISSRTLHVPWDEAGCLCPVGDLFNYAAPGEESSSYETVDSWMSASFLQDGSLSSGNSRSNVFVEKHDANMQRLTDGGFDEDKAAYCFYARKNYKKGEQVLLSYGTYTNLELLEFYGFCLGENSNDKVFIPLEPSMYICNSWPMDSLYIHQDGKPSFALLSALRLWATPPNQRRSIRHLAYCGSQLSVENEIMVMKWISKNCESVLNSLPTTVEEDKSLLSSIDKLRNRNKTTEVKKMMVCEFEGEGEINAFLEANNLEKVENVGELLFSSKKQRSIERWKLAVEWRLRYKTMLIDCISYCAEIINSLSTQNASTLRTI